MNILVLRTFHLLGLLSCWVQSKWNNWTERDRWEGNDVTSCHARYSQSSFLSLLIAFEMFSTFYDDWSACFDLGPLFRSIKIWIRPRRPPVRPSASNSRPPIGMELGFRRRAQPVRRTKSTNERVAVTITINKRSINYFQRFYISIYRAHSS